MNNTGYAMFDSECMIISDVYTNPGDVMNEMLEKGYTAEDMHTNGFELCKITTDGCTWDECLDVIEY